MQAGEPPGLVQHAQHEWRQGVADAGDRAQGVGRVEFAVERFDLAAEPGELAFGQAQSVDLEGDLQLQTREVDRRPVQAPGLRRGRLEPVHQGLSEGATVRVVAAGMLGDEAEQHSPPRLGDARGIQQVVEDGLYQLGPEVRQHSL